MKVIISHAIRDREFGKSGIPEDDLTKILKTYAKGISDTIKGKPLPPYSKLIKAVATSKRGARRLVFLVDLKTGYGHLLFYRSKDDAIGKNITMNNPKFASDYPKHLYLHDSDMKDGRFDVYDISPVSK